MEPRSRPKSDGSVGATASNAGPAVAGDALGLVTPDWTAAVRPVSPGTVESAPWPPPTQGFQSARTTGPRTSVAATSAGSGRRDVTRTTTGRSGGSELSGVSMASAGIAQGRP